jgi:putative ATPase
MVKKGPTMDLFETNRAAMAPLAERMRPETLDAYLGQKHLVAPGKLLRRAIETDQLTSMIFWGPPGTGKTTLASIISKMTSASFVRLNAVTSGVKELRDVIAAAEEQLRLYRRRTVLFIDEVHRYSKAQQDALLPALEQGTVIMIAGTTENPMLSLTPALLSRCRVFPFYPLDLEDLRQGMERALRDEERGLGMYRPVIEEDAAALLIDVSGGDLRTIYNALELAVQSTEPDRNGRRVITREIAEESVQRRMVYYNEDDHYDILSAFCKSLRGGDADAALYWFARMMYSGEDPRTIVRRMIVHASEDIGMANPQALQQAVAAAQALELVGMPEARIPIAQAILYLCHSPKSNSVVKAVDAAFADVAGSPPYPVPLHLRDTHYQGARRLGHGQGYKYPHDYPGHVVEQEYLPEAMRGRVYYEPSGQGLEARLNKKKERGGPAKISR